MMCLIFCHNTLMYIIDYYLDFVIMSIYNWDCWYLAELVNIFLRKLLWSRNCVYFSLALYKLFISWRQQKFFMTFNVENVQLYVSIIIRLQNFLIQRYFAWLSERWFWRSKHHCKLMRYKNLLSFQGKNCYFLLLLLVILVDTFHMSLQKELLYV